jgi:RES domain-containing protein
MSIRVWRISHKDYADTAFTGEGARICGGRFNSEGIPAVYCSGSLSLAILEILVQTDNRGYLKHCVWFYADIPEELVYEPELNELPDGWDAIPYGSDSQNFGDRWMEAGESAVMKIPSVVVPIEHNYVMNPLHSGFEEIEISEFENLKLDSRFLP